MSGLVLIVEDVADLLATLAFNLESEGYATRRAMTGAAALELAVQEPIPSLVLLDLMLPDMSGTEVCRRLRADSRTADVPIVMLTAKSEESDRVVGFEVGADDYVTKPFSVRELLLRFAAVLRRTTPMAAVVETLVFGPLTVDEAAHRGWLDESELDLTTLEFKLLVTLLSRRGRVQSRSRLLVDVWNYGDVNTRTVDTHVKRLREKLGPAGAFIETVRGVGYRFRTQPEKAIH
jgi:two-component system phosphate regulon response regulator PhoB